MPKIDKTNDNMFSRTNTGADFNRALGVLKDSLVVIDSGMVSSRIIPTGFKYIMGTNELEVYINGLLLRRNESINGTIYGDYSEHTNFSIMINTPVPSGFIVGSLIRFRITAANYKVSSISGAGGIDPSVITALQNDVAALNSQMTSANNTIQQVGHDSFGGSYAFPGTAAGSTRTIGTITSSDTTPDLTSYRVWKTNNSVATSITGFDNGVREDQRMIIIEDSNTTFINSSTLILVGGVNITPSNGSIVVFVYDGTAWRQWGTSGLGLTKWTQTSGTFTQAPYSSSALTMTTDLTSLIIPGMALKYKIAGTYYYGICSSIASNLLSIKGAPLTANVTELYYDQALSKVIEMVIPITGSYETASSTTILASYCNYYLPWSKQTSYLVNYSFISQTVDSGVTEGKASVTINGSDVNTSTGGLSLAAAATLYTTIVNINSSTYTINNGQFIEISATAGTNGDATNLTAILTFVCP